MSDEPIDVNYVEKFTRAVVAAQAAVMEEWCERSLVDPEGRGVLVIWDEYPLSFRIGLSAEVPWGSLTQVGAHPGGTLPEADDLYE